MPESVAVRHTVQLVLDLFDPALDVAAQPVNGFLVAVFALLVFLQHSEKQIDVHSRPDALADAQLEDFADALFRKKVLLSVGFESLNHGNHPPVISLNGEATPMSQSLRTSPLCSSIA